MGGAAMREYIDLDPPEPKPFKAQHRECTHWDACPCDCGWGICREYGEHELGTEYVTVPDECDAFEPNSLFDPDREAEELANIAYDIWKDEQLERALA